MSEPNTAPCAREGCGAPKAWHTRSSTFEDLATWRIRDDKHMYAFPGFADDACLGSTCLCAAYIAPEPPKPERTAYVVESIPLSRRGAGVLIRQSSMIPLADYLGSHPQPAPRMCICGGREDEHGEDGQCWHVARWFGLGGIGDGGYFEMRHCHCREFRAVVK